MKAIIALSLILIGTGLKAAELSNEVNYFVELKTLFDTGENVTINKISNKLFSGRCFKELLPRTPRNAGLIIYKYQYNYNYYQQIYKGNVLHAAGYFPSYFDSLTVRDLGKFSEIPLFKVADTNDSSTIYFPDSGKHKLRQNGNFIISEYSSIEGADDVGPIDESNRKTTMRCYFFN